MKRLLVTGVSGLLGLNLAWTAGDRFHVTGVMRGERAVPLPGRTPFVTILADLTQPGEVERVVEAAQPDAIIHCAALTNVDRCEHVLEEAELANAWLPGRLAAASRRSGVKLVQISTDAVFDGLRGGYTEEDQPNPINAYARSKLQGERAVADADPDALIARVNFYGWSWQGRRSLSEWFFLNLSAGRRVYGFTDLHFCPLLVNDMTEILLRMLERDLSGIYHIVSGECLSKFVFGRLLARAFGLDENLISPASYRTAGMEAPRSSLLSLRCDKLVRALGEEMPAQEIAMQRYADLYFQGYPQALRSVFVEPDHSLAG